MKKHDCSHTTFFLLTPKESTTKESINLSSQEGGLGSSMELSSLAIPGLSILTTILSYGSQYLFLHIAPSPLTQGQTIRFNLLVACIWISYFRACFTDPGRIPKERVAPQRHSVDNGGAEMETDAPSPSKGGRWCRKCEAPKPPRAHHCKTCRRLVLTHSYAHLSLFTLSKKIHHDI